MFTITAYGGGVTTSYITTGNGTNSYVSIYSGEGAPTPHSISTGSIMTGAGPPIPTAMSISNQAGAST